MVAPTRRSPPGGSGQPQSRLGAASRSKHGTSDKFLESAPGSEPRALCQDADLDQIVHELDTRPRKCLGYRIPIEVEERGVALTT